MIEVDQLEKVFETQDGTDIHALAEVSVTVDPAEFVVIVGPSGCGKSTASCGGSTGRRSSAQWLCSISSA